MYTTTKIMYQKSIGYVIYWRNIKFISRSISETKPKIVLKLFLLDCNLYLKHFFMTIN